MKRVNVLRCVYIFRIARSGLSMKVTHRVKVKVKVKVTGAKKL